MPPSSKRQSAWSTPLLPNDDNKVNAIFTQMVAPIADVEEKMYALNFHRGITRLGYKADLVYDDDTFSHIKIYAADFLYIEVRAIVDEDGITLPLMVYQEFEDDIRPVMESAFGISGTYLYQADFTVMFDDAAAMRLEGMELIGENANYASFVGIIDHSADDFHEFLQGAFYKIFRQLNVEIYPELRATKRKVF